MFFRVLTSVGKRLRRHEVDEIAKKVGSTGELSLETMEPTLWTLGKSKTDFADVFLKA